MIPKEEMEDNARDFIRALNSQGIVGLGAMIIFFDVKQGQPVIAGNVPKDKMKMVLGEIYHALGGIEVREELQ